MEHTLHIINSLVFGPASLTLILGTGLYFSLRGGFFQLRRLPQAILATLTRDKAASGGITPFQAVSTALAGTMGTGNIVGVAAAIIAGGPGAVFWMWISALLGMMTKYVEIVLAVRYRRRGPDGLWRGGPMYYLRDGAGSPLLAVAFAACCAFASLGVGNSTQSNAMAGALYAAFGVPPIVTGLAAAAIAGAVISGGIKRIGRATELMIPFVSLLYLLAGGYVLARNAHAIPGAFGLILRSAFGLRQAAGGAVGFSLAETIRLGATRGIYSNEAGLGSAPIAHASADCSSPERQGLLGVFEVFADTVLVCTMTALIILTAPGELWLSGIGGAALTGAALSATIGSWGAALIAVSLVFFGVSTIIGWFHYGEVALTYLTRSRRIARLYRWAYLVITALSACVSLDLLWEVSDILNGLMAAPNLIGIALLGGRVAAEARRSSPRL